MRPVRTWSESGRHVVARLNGSLRVSADVAVSAEAGDQWAAQCADQTGVWSAERTTRQVTIPATEVKKVGVETTIAAKQAAEKSSEPSSRGAEGDEGSLYLIDLKMQGCFAALSMTCLDPFFRNL